MNVHIRVVMTYELDSNDLEDQSFSFVLNCLGRQVCLPEVDDLRREVKADVLSLFVDVLDMPSIHGAAKIIGTYHVIEWLAAFRQPVWGFTHELGHNIGCRHQFLQDSSLSPFAYCHAYSRSSSPFFQTVVGFSPNENTILRFSNPDLLHSGVPMGDPATANNALCIRNSAQNLASRQISDCDGDGVCDIDEDCNGNGVPDPCDLDCGPAGGLCDVPNCGLAPDCNFSCVPDSCDITAGTSADCNANGVPDECDPDCDGDGIPDDCDSSCCIDSDCQAGNVCCNFVCRECCDPGDCGSGQVCCDYNCEAWECCDDSDCTVPLKFLCRTTDYTCVVCLSDDDCGANMCCTVSGTCSSFACAQQGPQGP
ncbi:MAG: hypothetical protein IIC01_08165 [Planctomycetes bacterium]|nr:hypothetical protein [Planctomycetota bacterium]